jgi:hypothetical protein
LAAKNSQPVSPAAIMRLIALPPAPPTPMTRIDASFWGSSTNSIGMFTTSREDP